MRVAIVGCCACDKPLDPETEVMWCTACLPTCCNCGSTDHEAGPIDIVTDECTACVDEHGAQA